MPREIQLLDHWGIRGRATRTANRAAAVRRPLVSACHARRRQDGFFEMQTLYDQLLRYKCFRRYDELFVTDIVVEDGRFVASSACTRRVVRRSSCRPRPC